MPAQQLALVLGICLAGAVLTGLCGNRRRLAGWISLLATSLSSLLAVTASWRVVEAAQASGCTLWALPQFGSALRLYVDGLAAVFLVLTAIIAFAATLYSMRFLDCYREGNAGWYHACLQIFLAGIYGLVGISDMMFFFCFFWQLMLAGSYALVRFEKNKPENVRAANRYLFFMEGACLLAMLGADLLAGGNARLASGEVLLKYDAEAIGHGMAALMAKDQGAVTGALALFLIAFGIKAGMWPFGRLWLPDADASAPAPIGSLLSGVAIKLGVYGLIRTFICLIPPSVLSLPVGAYSMKGWGILMALLGTITLFIGTVQALKQEQTLRLLAYHSIGQVGYILLGLGACLTLIGSGDKAVVALAAAGFYGAIFHTINHGLFKSLLFLNAGSMYYRTGTQDLNKMGGLMKYMPATALTALIASFSISGVPLFNGFASKWSIYVSTILGTKEAGCLAFFSIVAILTSAVTLASFMKFFGISFLSRTSRLVREKGAVDGHMEVGPSMLLPQVLLAFMCMLLGVAPIVFFVGLGQALGFSTQGLGELLAVSQPATIGALTGFKSAPAVFAPVMVMFLMLFMFGVVILLSNAGGAARRETEPWFCGYARESEQNRYTAHGLYGEIKRHLHWAGAAPQHSPPAEHPAGTDAGKNG
ncbi:MAG: proton-conducting transporter membrane subunit [Verrucomicrobiae bacterium]|nr:proton-conducting transporter membrane subunit [Verrucomicrobiae bacterium]